jgi:hypothetical protein
VADQLAPSGVMQLDDQSVYYRVILHSTQWGLVWAWLPDTFTMSLVEDWQFIIGQGGSPLVQLASDLALKGRVRTKYQTAKVWMGSDVLKFALPLRFIARRDSAKEVINPIKTVMKMALPRMEGGGWVLTPPGPSLAGDLTDAFTSVVTNIARGGSANTAGDRITLYIGNYLRIKDIFIENIQVTFRGILNQAGDPMESSCLLTCNTMYAPTASDVDDWILSSSGTDESLRDPYDKQGLTTGVNQ